MLMDAVFVLLLLVALLAGVTLYRRRRNLLNWVGQMDSYFLADTRPSGSDLWRLFFVSVSSLYIEIMLIRWMGTEVRIFAYFQNLALIACFLGFGLGCYFCGRRRNLLYSLAALTVLAAMIHAPIYPWRLILMVTSALLSISPDAVMWGGLMPGLGRETVVLATLVAIVAVAVFLILAVLVMIPPGQWVGYYLDRSQKPLAAYSVNLLGSLAGMWLFAGQSFLWLSPSVWVASAFALLILLLPSSRRMKLAAGILLGVMLVLLRMGGEAGLQTFWSPYQKIEVQSLGEEQYMVQVNNTNYMSIANGTPAFVAKHPKVAAAFETSSYDAPYQFASGVEDVLIVGAGAGNDAAAALRHGAVRVDAVEIDPVILHVGEVLHPDRPYAHPNVRTILMDARAFMRRTTRRYDVVVFGLLDSHTEYSSFSNMRIDNYVYTEESFREAQRLLKPSGILVVKFEVRPPWTWIGQRLYAMLAGVFGSPPVAYYAKPVGNYLPATVFLTSNDHALWRRALEPPLAAKVVGSPPPFSLTVSGSPRPTTDEWPYLYHRNHSVPRTYWTVSLILLLIAFFFVRDVLEPRRPTTWYFFFLGAGFMLLETQMVSRLALYFGTTWLVNCFALSAILIVLVAANIWVLWFHPQNLTVYYVLLVVSLVANFSIAWDRFPWDVRTVGVVLMAAYGVSVFMAGVIFASAFEGAMQKSTAFGANLVGAVAGGLAQNISFIVGLKMLLVMAAVIYLAAGVFGRLAGRQKTEMAPVASAFPTP